MLGRDRVFGEHSISFEHRLLPEVKTKHGRGEHHVYAHPVNVQLYCVRRLFIDLADECKCNNHSQV
jgi:hypothetical protein